MTTRKKASPPPLAETAEPALVAEKPETSDAEDRDRSPAIAIFLSGESFLQMAIHSHEAIDAKTLKIRSVLPVYYLYSHALELTLKAFLRANGVPSEELSRRKFGHNLINIWKECVARGMKLDVPKELEAIAMVKALAPYAASYEFRYVQTGAKTLPTLDAVRRAAEMLHTAIRPIVHVTVPALTARKPVEGRGQTIIS